MIPWQGLEQLTALMFSKAGPKRLGQDMVSGGVLAALATAYVDAINGGAVPTIATAWQVCTAGGLVHMTAMTADHIRQLRCTSMDSTTLTSICMQGVAEAECRRAADAAEQAYVAAFSKNVEPDEGALEVEHRRALDAAAAAYEVAHNAWATAYHGYVIWTDPDAYSRLGGCPEISVQRYALAHIGSVPAPHKCWDAMPVECCGMQAGAIGEAAVRRAGDERWRAAVAARFQQVKQSRLASAALACEQLINQATTRLTQVDMPLIKEPWRRLLPGGVHSHDCSCVCKRYCIGPGVLTSQHSGTFCCDPHQGQPAAPAECSLSAGCASSQCDAGAAAGAACGVRPRVRGLNRCCGACEVAASCGVHARHVSSCLCPDSCGDHAHHEQPAQRFLGHTWQHLPPSPW